MSSPSSSSLLSWSIEDYCKGQIPLDWSTIPHVSTRNFLQSLPKVSTVHPFCQGDNFSSYYLKDIPRQGPLTSTDHMETVWDVIVTYWTLTFFSLAAMAELWLRFFALILAPLFVLVLIADECSLFPVVIIPISTKGNKNDPSRNNSRSFRLRYPVILLGVSCILSVASSIVLLTDTLYILEFGPYLGATLLTLSAVLSIRTCLRHGLIWTLRVVCILFGLCAWLVVRRDATDGVIRVHFGEPLERIDTVSEGFYYDSNNTFISQLAKNWSPRYWSYNAETNATLWMYSGDARTGLPFLLNRFEFHGTWHRLWLPVEDGEVLGLDFSFPPGGYNASKPVYMILHGINGGSHEAFVQDFALRRTVQDGATVCVMVARGLMDLPVRGWNNFHGARWTDAHETSLVLKQGMAPGQILVATGYSMGAIILANWVGRAGPECALDAAVAISGSLDTRFQKQNYRAQRLFQPIITVALRDEFVLGKWGNRARARLSKEQMKAMMRATHITEIDSIYIVNYNGFRDVDHYYSEMSLLGDIPLDEYQSAQGIHENRRVHQISIPTLIVHALDDPLITWRTTAANKGAMHPTNLVRTGTGNLMLLLTKRGGHVGWSTGMLPHLEKWKWMNDAPATFVESLIKIRQLQEQHPTEDLHQNKEQEMLQGPNSCSASPDHDEKKERNG